MRVKKFRPRESRDKLIYGNGIVEGIVLLAVSEMPYAKIYRGVMGKSPVENAVKVVIDKSNVTVDVTVTVNYQQSVSDMAFKIQEAVKYNVESMTDYNVVSVNVIVKGVTFDDVPAANHDQNGENKQNSDAAMENNADNPAEIKPDAASERVAEKDSDK